jgi:hypothetical protein
MAIPVTPVTLIIFGCLISSLLNSIGSIFCPPRMNNDKSQMCMSTTLTGLSNSAICVVILLMILNVIPMPERFPFVGGEN